MVYLSAGTHPCRCLVTGFYLRVIVASHQKLRINVGTSTWCPYKLLKSITSFQYFFSSVCQPNFSFLLPLVFTLAEMITEGNLSKHNRPGPVKSMDPSAEIHQRAIDQVRSGHFPQQRAYSPATRSFVTTTGHVFSSGMMKGAVNKIALYSLFVDHRHLACSVLVCS